MDDEREMYPELLLDFEEVPGQVLERALWAITSGCKAFGYLVEWSNWFTYLAPHMVRSAGCRFGRESIFQLLVTASITMQLPANPDQGMANVLLEPVGQTLMQSQFWDASGDFVDYDGLFNRESGILEWFSCSQNLNAAICYLFLTLSRDQISDWVLSIMAIEGTIWRANIFAFVAEGIDFFYQKPTDSPLYSAGYKAIGWENSFLLKDTIFAGCRENIDLFFDTFFAQLSEEKLLAWCEPIWAHPAIGEAFQVTQFAETLMREIGKRKISSKFID